MKYAVPAGALLFIALLIALALAPWMAEWIAGRAAEGQAYETGFGWLDTAEPAAVAGADDVRDPRWPIGSFALVAAFLGFAALGGLVMSVIHVPPPPPPDPKAKRLRKVQPLIDSVAKRGDLTPEEKDGFRDSATALAEADDPPSIRAAELVGKGDAVTAAKGLAEDAENELMRSLRHAVNVATPFSDTTGAELAKRRGHFGRIDALAGEVEECAALKERIRKLCKCGKPLANACTCGEDACDQCRCEACCTPDPHKAHRARLDVVWD